MSTMPTNALQSVKTAIFNKYYKSIIYTKSIRYGWLAGIVVFITFLLLSSNNLLPQALATKPSSYRLALDMILSAGFSIFAFLIITTIFSIFNKKRPLPSIKKMINGKIARNSGGYRQQLEILDKSISKVIDMLVKGNEDLAISQSFVSQDSIDKLRNLLINHIITKFTFVSYQIIFPIGERIVLDVSVIHKLMVKAGFPFEQKPKIASVTFYTEGQVTCLKHIYVDI